MSEPPLSHALRVLLMKKLGEHREEYAQDQLLMWKRIAAELSAAPEAEGTVFCYQQLSLFFKRHLVCKLKELRLTTDQDLIDRLQFPYLRKVYELIIKFVERHTAKQSEEEKQQNRLFIKYMFNSVQYDPAVVAAFKSRSKKRTPYVFINVNDPEYQLRPDVQKLLLQMTKTSKVVKNRPVKGSGVVQPEQMVSTPIVLDGVSVPIDAASPAEGRSVGDLLETETLSFNTQQYNDIISESLEPGLAPAHASVTRTFDPDEVICIDDSDSSESEDSERPAAPVHSVTSAVKAEIDSNEGRKIAFSSGGAQILVDAHYFSDQSESESTILERSVSRASTVSVDQDEDSVIQPLEMVLLNGSKSNNTSERSVVTHDPFQTSNNASPTSAGQSSAALQMNAITSSSEKSTSSNPQQTPLCTKKAATIRKLAFDETGAEIADSSEDGLGMAPLPVPPPVAAEVVPENECNSQSEENVGSEPLFTPSSGECANNETQQPPLQNLPTVNEGTNGLEENPVAAAASCHRNEDAEMAEDQPQSSQIDQADTNEPTPESSVNVPAAIAASTKATAQTQTPVPWSERQRRIEPTIAKHSLVREVLQHRWPELFTRDPSRFSAIWDFSGMLSSLMFPKLRPTDGKRLLGLMNMVSFIAVRIVCGATDGQLALPDNSASHGEAAAQSRRRKLNHSAEGGEEAENLRLVKKRKVDAAELRKQNS